MIKGTSLSIILRRAGMITHVAVASSSLELLLGIGTNGLIWCRQPTGERSDEEGSSGGAGTIETCPHARRTRRESIREKLIGVHD